MAAQLIALTGRAQSGKSTSAEVLMVDYGFQRVKFADPLKDMLRVLFGYAEPGVDPERFIEGDLKDRPCSSLGGRTPRHAMITLGTEWGRDLITQDLWLNLARARITTFMNAGFDVVVDDCRFANEAAVIRSMGGRIVEVVRSTGALDLTHLSEQGCGEPDEYILNQGTVEQLHASLREIL